jgi:hypothetical protein
MGHPWLGVLWSTSSNRMSESSVSGKSWEEEILAFPGVWRQENYSWQGDSFLPSGGMMAWMACASCLVISVLERRAIPLSWMSLSVAHRGQSRTWPKTTPMFTDGAWMETRVFGWTQLLQTLPALCLQLPGSSYSGSCVVSTAAEPSHHCHPHPVTCWDAWCVMQTGREKLQLHTGHTSLITS